MGWEIGEDTTWNRDIGYGVPAFCDFPGCLKKIDRGLSYVCCGEQPHGGDHGCGLYFCEAHHSFFKYGQGGMCARCYYRRAPYKPSPEHPEWIMHKLIHPSWKEWRHENLLAVLALLRTLPEADAANALAMLMGLKAYVDNDRADTPGIVE